MISNDLSNDHSVFQIRNMREAGDSRISALLHILHKSISSTSMSDPSQRPLPPIDMVFTSADKEGIDPRAKAGWAIDKRVDEPLDVGTWLMVSLQDIKMISNINVPRHMGNLSS